MSDDVRYMHQQQQTNLGQINNQSISPNIRSLITNNCNQLLENNVTALDDQLQQLVTNHSQTNGRQQQNQTQQMQQQQQQQMMANNNRYSISSNPLMGDKLFNPSVAGVDVDSSSAMNNRLGRHLKGKWHFPSMLISWRRNQFGSY